MTLPILTLLLACAQGPLPFAPDELIDARHPTGSTTLALTPDGEHIVVAEPDRGLAVIDSDGAVLYATTADGPAARVARVGEHIVATFRDSREVRAYSWRHGALELEQTIVVGAEPVGIVAREDGLTFYVACMGSGEVYEIEGENFGITRRWDVPNKPKWLALRPRGDALIVAPELGGDLFRINLVNSRVIREPLPVANPPGGIIERRITGDLSISPDGQTLAVPSLYVDAKGVIVPPLIQTWTGTIEGAPIDRVNPAVVVSDLAAMGTLAASTPIIFSDRPYGHVTSASWELDSSAVTVVMQGADRVLRLPRDERSALLDMQGSGMFQLPAGAQLHAPGGPEHVLWLDDQTQAVHQTMARSVLFTGEHSVSGRPFPTPESDAELGRRLFHSAIDSRVSNANNPASCAMCHVDGGSDGLVWVGEGQLHATPSLETAHATAPYSWFDDVPSMVAEIEKTTTTRLEAPTPRDAEAIVAYLQGLTVADTEHRGGETDAVARGREIFHRSDVGCGSCHSGEYLTDGIRHDIPGLGKPAGFERMPTATPTLIGIASTPPYFHDGSAATLEDVVRFSRKNSRMGDTSGLTDEDEDDLVAFLKSL